MIELGTLHGRPVVSVRLVGMQSATELGELSGAIARCVPGGEPLRILFDWTALEGWDVVEMGVSGCCRQWMSVACRIERVSIVHAHRWNRQASLLAAALRRQAAVVRSWPPRRLSDAIDWLADDR